MGHRTVHPAPPAVQRVRTTVTPCRTGRTWRYHHPTSCPIVSARGGSHSRTKTLPGMHLAWLLPLQTRMPHAPLYLPVSTPDNQIYVPCQTRSRRSHRCALSSHRHPARLWDVRPGPPWGPRSDGDDTGGPRSGGGVIPAEAVGGGYSFPRETEDAGEGATKGTPSSGLFRWVRLTRSFDTTASHREAESVQSSSHQKSLHCSARSAWLVHG
jgi:hypothetical protein